MMSRAHLIGAEDLCIVYKFISFQNIVHAERPQSQFMKVFVHIDSIDRRIRRAFPLRATILDGIAFAKNTMQIFAQLNKCTTHRMQVMCTLG